MIILILICYVQPVQISVVFFTTGNYEEFFSLFEVNGPTGDLFTLIETSPLPVWGCKFWPMLGTYDLWAVPHLLWHGTSVYNGHLRGRVIVFPIAECLTVELSLPVFMTMAVGIRTPNLPLAWPALKPGNCAIAAVNNEKKTNVKSKNEKASNQTLKYLIDRCIVMYV